MQPPPLQVETVTDFWDELWTVLGSIGDFVGGVGTALALVIAAMAYRRQVDDARRAQAAKVVIRLEPEPYERTTIVIENSSDAPVYQVVISIATVKEFRRTIEKEVLPALGMIYALEIDNDDRSLYGIVVQFEDASGHKWERNIDGGLHSR